MLTLFERLLTKSEIAALEDGEYKSMYKKQFKLYNKVLQCWNAFAHLPESLSIDPKFLNLVNDSRPMFNDKWRIDNFLREYEAASKIASCIMPNLNVQSNETQVFEFNDICGFSKIKVNLIIDKTDSEFVDFELHISNKEDIEYTIHSQRNNIFKSVLGTSLWLILYAEVLNAIDDNSDLFFGDRVLDKEKFNVKSNNELLTSFVDMVKGLQKSEFIFWIQDTLNMCDCPSFYHGIRFCGVHKFCFQRIERRTYRAIVPCYQWGKESGVFSTETVDYYKKYLSVLDVQEKAKQCYTMFFEWFQKVEQVKYFLEYLGIRIKHW